MLEDMRFQRAWYMGNKDIQLLPALLYFFLDHKVPHWWLGSLGRMLG